MHQLSSEDADVEVVWRAFELRPDPVPTLDPQGEYLQRAWQGSVYPLAARLGMTMKLPPVQPRSRLAHQAAHWARQQGRFDEYNEAVFRAFFERGENIGESDVLVNLAHRLNLDGEGLRDALDSREYESSVLSDEQQAQSLGIGGVPAFVAGRRTMLSGVQPVEALKELVASTRQDRPG